MHIERLSINGVRNLSAVQLSNCGQINLIYGVNGAGKTSVLEALSMLCVGRSFKARQFKSVINTECDTAVVHAKGKDAVSGVSHSLGVSRTRSNPPEAKLDGANLKSLANLASLTPLQLLDASSFQLVEGSPSERRAFLDWGVFHVEHEFNTQWQILRKCLKQRNSMLRRGKIDASLLRAWDQELFRAAEVVDRCRAQYTDKLITQYRELAGHLSDVPLVDIRYKRGWSDDLSLEDAMTEGLDRDLRTGITNVGPHRADLHISVDGVQAAERLSRGQEKTLICTLKLAQVALLLKETGKRCLFLIDDFAAELDIHNRERLVQLLQVLDSQVFITGITREDLANSWSEQSDLRVFHVEHGEITSQSDSEQGMTLDV